MKKLTLALCIASVVGTSSVYANNGEPNGYKKYHDKSHVSLKKKVKVTKDLEYEGHVRIGGKIEANGLGMAVVENNQKAAGNSTLNFFHDNKSKINDDVFRNVTGNLGVNEAAGTNNIQSNNAAIAAIDANFAFGSGDAEIFSKQQTYRNRVGSFASTNKAVISDDAFRDTHGNIGVNITAGDNNIQTNNLALSTYNGYLGEASVSNYQSSGYNMTPREIGRVGLQETASGNSSSELYYVKQNTNNTSTLTDNAFKGASGNIGVNISTGSGNLQSNSLALSTIQANGVHKVD